jgi:hypothetical protein
MASRTSSVPSSCLRRLGRLAGPVPMTLWSPVASPTSSGPSTRLRRSITSHIAPSKKSAHRPASRSSPNHLPDHLPDHLLAPPRSPPRSPSRVYLQCFAKHQCDILSFIRATSSRVSRISEPGVEDGGQDKEVPPRLRWTADCKQIFGGRPFGQFTRRVPDLRTRPRLPEVPSCPRVTTIPAARCPGRRYAKSKRTGPACGRGWADARGLRAARPASLGWCSAVMAGAPRRWARWARCQRVVTRGASSFRRTYSG